MHPDSQCATSFDRRKPFPAALVTILVFAIAFLTGGRAIAQVDTAAIGGTVRDSTGAVIPKATVQIHNRDTGLVRTTTTNGSGTYQLGEIPPGVYNIEAQAQGFSTSTHENATLALSQSLVFNFTLQVGSTTSTVEVATGGISLDTASATLGITIPAETITELPLNGNNYTQELLLMPGVNGVNHDSTGGRTNSVGAVTYPSVNGATNRSNTYYLDGVNNNEAISGAQIITPISADIQQMTAVTHADSSAFGGALGGIINVITKSGTNNLHGSAWEYWQSARFFDAANAITKTLSDNHQNQFGFSVGGPVVIPHLYHGRNKTFFYGSYEGYRQTTGSVQQALVPTTAQLGELTPGFYDFSADLLKTTPVIIYNPYTGQPFPNNQIPANMVDQNMVNYIKTVYPVVGPSALSLNSGTANYQSTVPGTHTSNQYDIRGDEYLSKRDVIWAHFLHQNDPTSGASAIPNLRSVTGYVARNFGAQWNHTFGPGSLLTVGFGQNIGDDEPTTSYSGNVDAIDAAAGFSQGISCGITYKIRPSGCMLPQIGETNYIGGGENQGAPNYVSVIWEYTANYQQQIGKHNISVGFNVDTNNQGKATSAYTAIGFGQNQTSNGVTGGDALASMLLSLPNGATRLNEQNQEHGGYEQGYYVQDQWKIRDNLTINYGLRYDLTLLPAISNAQFGPYYDIFDYYTGQDIIESLPPACSATQFAPCIPGGTLPANVVVSAQPGKFFFPDKKNFEPRFGLSYQIRPSLVFHAGYGRVFDNWAAVDQTAQNVDGWLVKSIDSVANLNQIQQGTRLTPGATTTAENPLVGFVGNYPAATPFSGVAGSFNTPPQFTAPHSDQWTVGIQQKLGAEGVWTINYVGSRGANIDLGLIANTALPGPGPIAPRTPFPYMGQSHWDVPLNVSDYNALQTSFQGRDKKSGLSYIISYTWAHSIDIGADDWYGAGTGSIEHPYNLRLDRSNSGFDEKYVFTSGWTWTVPVGKGGSLSTGSKAVDYAVGNWKLNGIISLDCGAPYNLSVGGDIANTGNTGTYERPNLIGNPNLSNPSRAQWFNTAAFVAPPQYTLGTVGRNSMFAPGYRQFDTSLFRNFPLFHDKSVFMIRMDAFNVLNHPINGTPGSSLTNTTTFGKITSQGNSPRQLQLAGKITF